MENSNKKYKLAAKHTKIDMIIVIKYSFIPLTKVHNYFNQLISRIQITIKKMVNLENVHLVTLGPRGNFRNSINKQV